MLRTGRRSVWSVGAALAGVLAAAALAACGSSSSNGNSGGGGSRGGTINVGNISAVTGPVPLGDAAAGAKSFFDALNASGGISGTKVNFIIGDDKTDPALSARLARQEIQQQNVVAFVGDLTLVGCTVNRQLFVQSKVRSIMAGGSDPSCFKQPNVSPVNTGSQSDFEITTLYAAQHLHAKHVCSLFTNAPSVNATHAPIIAYFEQHTGQKMAYADETLGQNSNLPAMFANAKTHGCDAIVTDGTPNQTGPMVQARDQEGLSKVPLIFQGSQYNAALAKQLGNVQGVYSISEMIPFTENSPALSAMKADMAKDGVALNGLSQFGWYSAKVFDEIASEIHGPITRDSINKALLGLTSLDSGGWTATPYSFGTAQTHNPNRGGKIVEIKNGKWVVVTPSWIILPS